LRLFGIFSDVPKIDILLIILYYINYIEMVKNNSSQLMRKNNMLKHLRVNITRKSKLIVSNKEIFELFGIISVKKRLPTEIRNKLSYTSFNKMDKKLKIDLTEFNPRFKNIIQEYSDEIKRLATKLFNTLPHKYRRGYINALEKDIDIPLKQTLIFLINHRNDLVSFIGNRYLDVHSDVSDYIFSYYGEYGIEPPKKIKFRTLVNDVEQYFELMVDPLA